MIGTQPALVAKLLPTHVRYTSIPFSALIPIAIDGGQCAGKPLDFSHTVALSNPHAVCSLSGTEPLHRLPGG
jgi:hypothetical protein